MTHSVPHAFCLAWQGAFGTAWKACIRATVSWVRIPLPPPRFKYLTLLRYSNSAVCELSAVCCTSYMLADDHFRAETNSCGICGVRHGPVSFAEYSGTAVSRFSAEFAPGERDANERDDEHAIDST